MNRKNFEAYDTELDYYFIVCVHTDEGDLYAYNQRTLVHDEAFAKQFGTRRSARRCIGLSHFENSEILKKERIFKTEKKLNFNF